MNKNKNNSLLQWGKAFLYTFLFLFMISISILAYMVNLSYDLPTLDELKNFNPEQISKVISADGQVLHKLQAVKKREVVKIGEIPQELIDALIVMEDKEFYNHSGFSVRSTLRAVLINILMMEYKQGASTLTQQLARSMYEKISWKDRSIVRKIKELITAFNIEQTYTKSEILELYLNSVFLGHGRYGVQSAAQLYFKKNVSELNFDECAMLVGMLPAPNLYSPFKNLNLATERKYLVLDVMKQNELIDLYDYTFYYDKKLEIASRSTEKFSGIAPYFNEHVRKELEKIDSELGINIYRDGLKIHTTIDPKIQRIIENSFQENMKNNQKALNNEFINNPWRLKKIVSGTDYEVDEVLEILKNDKVIPRELRSKLLVQGAVVAIDPNSGNILGMIGGRQEEEYLDLHGFNRATQAKRQPGSIFKPFIYMTAIEEGSTPSTQLLNQPLVVFIDDTTQWNPQNHDGSTGLLTTLREGLKKSLNLISVRVAQELVKPKQIAQKAKSFNLSTRIASVESIALGVSDVIPIEMTSAYATIANEGVYNSPTAISYIEDQHGRVIKRFDSEQMEVVDENLNYIMLSMMKDVIDSGTGGSIRWRHKFKSPMAGKTGTTNNKTDAWFIGFTPQIALGVWVGVDDPSISLGKKQYGSKAALPIFADAIKEIYNLGTFYSGTDLVYIDQSSNWEIPDGVVVEKVCNETYEKATRWCTSIDEIYLDETKPRSLCKNHSGALKKKIRK
tara:strand:+ start:509 stop:2710 length:2202 start_codon:yes stop_codon:yes gene_type:complete